MTTAFLFAAYYIFLCAVFAWLLVGTFSVLIYACLDWLYVILTRSHDKIDGQMAESERYMLEKEAIACCNGLFDYAAEEDGEWIAWATRGEWREEFGIYCDPGCCGYRTGKTRLDAIQNLARWLEGL